MGRKAYKWVLKEWKRIPDLEAASSVVRTMRFSTLVEPQNLLCPLGKEAVVIAPHPDDEIIGPGGTLLKFQKAGGRVRVVFVTSGGADEASAREEEAKKACKLAGFEPIFFGQVHGEIDIDECSVLLEKLLVQNRPDKIFIPFVLDDHLDHRMVNRILGNLSEISYLRKTEIWAYQVYSSLFGNVVVDISSVIKEKESIIVGYKTQMNKRNWAHFSLGMNAAASRFLSNSVDAEEKYAECFYVIPMKEYVDLCRLYYENLI